MDGEFWWPFNSLGPIAPTRSKPLHWLTPSRACSESSDAHGIVLTAYRATVATTLVKIVVEGMVLFDNDDSALDRIGRCSNPPGLT
jgi:hypothetical protein